MSLLWISVFHSIYKMYPQPTHLLNTSHNGQKVLQRKCQQASVRLTMLISHPHHHYKYTSTRVTNAIFPFCDSHKRNPRFWGIHRKVLSFNNQETCYQLTKTWFKNVLKFTYCSWFCDHAFASLFQSTETMGLAYLEDWWSQKFARNSGFTLLWCSLEVMHLLHTKPKWIL